jgi:catechol 2,3-dioxygenase-like lactoylglutathione lyase family enzyme
MIGYVTLGTNDPARAARFYDELLALLGAKRLMDFGPFVLWGTSMEAAGLALTTPYDKNRATVGNGVMVALRATSKAQVDAIYKKALELGGSDEGPPGARSDGFYVGYFRDLDGNKLNAFFTG